MVADSSISAFYPDYHRPSDVAERLDARALERMGRAVLGTVRALDRAPVGPAADPHWFAAFGRVIGWSWLLGLGAAAMLPALGSGLASGGWPFGLRVLQTALFGVLLWRDPVLALWLLLLPNALLPLSRRLFVLVSLAPALALLTLGVLAWWRGAVSGVWLQPWEIAVAALALVLSLFALPRRAGARSGGTRGGSRRSVGSRMRNRGRHAGV
jgi:hypothetical protein